MGYLREKYTREYYLPKPGQGYGAEGYEEFKAGDIKQSVKGILASVDWTGKAVLDIGCGRGEALRYCLQHGAALVHGIDFSEAAVQIAEKTLGDCRIQGGSYIVEQGEAAEIQHAAEFDAILMLDVLEHIPEPEFMPVLWRVRRALKPSGLLIWFTPNYTDKKRQTATDLIPQTAGMHCNKLDWTNLAVTLGRLGFRSLGPCPDSKFFIWTESDEETPVYDPPAEEKRQTLAVVPKGHSNTMLHVHNVGWLGGTGNFVWDMARCFPEFHHVAVHVNDPNVDPIWEEAVRADMRTLHAPQLTPEILAEINPSIIVLHNTWGKSLAGEWPYAWLCSSGRFVISIHHNASKPHLLVDLDVFVSEYVKGFYKDFLVRCKRTLVMPPCIDVEGYHPEKRDWHVGRLLCTGAGKGALVPAISLDSAGPQKKAMGMHEHLAQHHVAVIWPQTSETWCRTLTECMASGMVVLAHASGALPEQIKHGETGFLFSEPEEGLQPLLREMHRTDRDRLREIGMAAHRRVKESASYDRMRRDLYPHLVRALTGAP